MTIVAEPPTETEVTRARVAPPDRPVAAADPTGDVPEPLPPIRYGPLIAGWVLITVVGILVVLVAAGPVSEERDQRALLGQYRSEIESASNQAFGLAGIEVPTEAPALGAPVAVIDIDRTQLSRVVVEGTDPEQTRSGPGHVVGSGGPGQPGNSVIVGRRGLFGGAFGSLDQLRPGDQILVTTTQGRSLYEVDHAGTHTIETSSSTVSAEPTTTTTTAAATDGTDTGAPDTAAVDGADGAGASIVIPDGPLTSDAVYGPSPDDRLTLVTTASGVPGSTGDAVVVVAHLEGDAFTPTPQGGRTPGNDGRRGSTGIAAALILALLAYVAAVIGTVWLHRNVPWRSAYLITAPVLVALTVVLAEQLASALPAWT